MAQQSNKAVQAAVVKILGERLKTARELCNMSLSIAAKRLGYANPSKLSKVENATDTNSVPVLLIVNAAKLYEVSIDYLFGLTDDWDNGLEVKPEREVTGWIAELFDRDMIILKRSLCVINKKLQAEMDVIIKLSESMGEIDQALGRVMELNPEFDEMRAGNRLVTSVEAGRIVANNAKVSLKRFKLEMNAVTTKRTPMVGDVGGPVRELFAEI